MGLTYLRRLRALMLTGALVIFEGGAAHAADGTRWFDGFAWTDNP